MAVNPQAGGGPSSADLDDIQGNLIGFNKDQQRLVFVGFPDAASGKAFLVAVAGDLATGSDVLAFNALYKQVKDRGGADGTVEATWLNVVLSAAGLTVLGIPGLAALPGEFTEGMAAQASAIGDVDASAPAGWLAPFNAPVQVHAMAILAADSTDDLQQGYERLQAKIATSHVNELGHQDGNVRPDPNRGREHFGFKDGISQPSIGGLTQSSKGGQDTIAAGEFLIGYPDQDGNVSGQPPPPGPAPQPGQPGYPGPAPAPAPGFPDWTKNGSFVAYRRLRQDVAAFAAFVGEQAGEFEIDVELLSAKLVGRWQSGAAMERVPALPAGTDPALADPSEQTPAVRDDDQINNFDYEPGDSDGHGVPRAAHIRKVNPRSANPPGKAESNRHRILRRGIPYGSEITPGETPYGQGPVPDERDRGLLFLCYQSSLSRGFMFLQRTWANNPDFPQANDGRDPIISQDVEPRTFNLPPHPAHLSMNRWVFTTGGEFFFSPSVSAVRAFGAA